MNEHEQSMQIAEVIAQLLADVPGTLRDHQQRIQSMNYLKSRLEELHKLESLAELAQVSEAPAPGEESE